MSDELQDANPPEETPTATATATATKKQHPQKVENPKTEQFTGRATVAESDRIQAALTANGCGKDIVRLTLKLLDQVERDNFPFQSFKTK